MKNLRRAFIFVALLLLSVLAVAFNTPVGPASAQLPSGSYKWVAITKQDWVPIVQPLADVRTSKGLPAYIASVEWIYANFPGADKPEQIRNFMKQAYENWGVQYLLIAGDVLAVPTHYEYQKDCRQRQLYTEFYADHRPTDWYYGYFDEPEVVAVGRMPAMNPTDLQVMVQKTVNYELSPPEGDWRRTAINAWGFDKPGESDIQENAARVRGYLSGLNQIEYAMPDNPMDVAMVDEALASMLDDSSILYVSAHGNTNHAGTLTVNTAKALRNGLKLPIVFAYSCGTAMFDDPYAEYVPPFNETEPRTFLPLELLRNPLGGCVSYVGYVGLGGAPFPLNWFFRDYRLGTMMATTMLSSNTLPDIAILGDPALQWVGASQYGSSITLQVPSRIEAPILVAGGSSEPVDVVATGRVDPPVAGAQIEGGTFQRIEGQSSLSFYGSYPTATTNADGTFQCTFPELKVGRYVLWVWWRGGEEKVGACSQFIEIEVVLGPTPPQTPRCIIVTAAYGSELAPEVIYMRHVRDNMIGSSSIGRILVGAWNAFYYSWSPPVAGFIASSPTLQTVFRALLVPLIGIVHVAAWVFGAVASFNADLASIVAFAFSAFMCVIVYILIPAKVLHAILKKVQTALSSVSQTIRLEARCR